MTHLTRDIWNFLSPSTDEINEVTHNNSFIISCYDITSERVRRGRDHMVVGFSIAEKKNIFHFPIWSYRCMLKLCLPVVVILD